ncbi:MAG: hypothetical protein JRG92_13290 [Deltaproteobacteria bacterium]|nr:hypothetical protein [Deltaproteobacteria bacterium]
MRRLFCTGLLLVLALTLAPGALADTGAPATPVAPAAAGSVSIASDPAPGPHRRPAPIPLRATADYRVSSIRAGIVGLGLVVFAWGLGLARESRGGLRRVRLGLLLLLAGLAFASYYQFFRLVHVGGFATNDNFHYYVGSKYFAELGYFGLYECSLVALADRGFAIPDDGRGKARDLRTMQERPLREILKAGQSCRERFSAERWHSFQNDVYYFVHRWPPHVLRAVWRDHGYHPSPTWTLIGGTVASSTSIHEPFAQHVLSRLDRYIVGIGIVMVAWAFGLESACLVAIVWGTGFIWRYTWVGDAFLRHLWWITALAGVCLIRRDRHLAGGAWLSTSALLRIFPACMSLGYLLHAGRAAWYEGRFGVGAGRFLLGAGVTAVLLVGLGVSTSQHGLTSLLDFATKITDFAALSTTNQVGLSVLARWAFPETPWAATLLRLMILVPFLALFWRGLRHAEAWEAAAFGLCLVPMLTEPTSYYFSFMAICALLAARRPHIGVIVLLTGLLWCLNGLVFYRQYDEYRWASLIAVSACFAIAAGMTRDAGLSATAESASTETPLAKRSSGSPIRAA